MLQTISTAGSRRQFRHEEHHSLGVSGGAETGNTEHAIQSDADQSGYDWLVAPFEPISLDELNAKASMLVRLDNKYVLDAADMKHAIARFNESFDVLEIDGLRRFNYETCYFDDEDNTSYTDHHRGRRKRFKVRLRKYVEAQLCFVEVKLKSKRGITIKKRMKQQVENYGTLDEAAIEHVRRSYAEVYGGDFNRPLMPSVEMRYQRVTLVSKEGDERMTIDFNLEFMRGERRLRLDSGKFIIETKSPNANGLADKILRSLHKHPTKNCSKYCVSMASMQAVDKYNRFIPAMRRLNVLPESKMLTQARVREWARVQGQDREAEYSGSGVLICPA
ncbi:polyphosphate polymerase domain-containing protein [Marinobacter daepoensis]|uniref:polyphosphate polymerase domain-containing protein n=1 Tax=Marinobacter daepoensis TaxID=262077 RepID=UPI001C981B09|nr:polyphosphate polymerase domain-containing protein [Marinobacter daepoensis]MBY6032049.1 polyphosphate polymerase domain-containing protein [Marinobacter daepoensis]